MERIELRRWQGKDLTTLAYGKLNLINTFPSCQLSSFRESFRTLKHVPPNAVTGVLSGYYFTQAFLSSRLAETAKQQALLRGNLTLTESEFEPERLHEVPSPRQ